MNGRKGGKEGRKGREERKEGGGKERKRNEKVEAERKCESLQYIACSVLFGKASLTLITGRRGRKFRFWRRIEQSAGGGKVLWGSC